MFPALKALNTAKAEGLIEQSEYDDHRAKILGGNPEAVRLWAGQGQDTAGLERKVDELLTAVQPASHGGLPRYDRTQHMTPLARAIVPVAREVGQRTLLGSGVTAHLKRKDGRLERLTEEDLSSRPRAFRCSFAGCHRTFARAWDIVCYGNLA